MSEENSVLASVHSFTLGEAHAWVSVNVPLLLIRIVRFT